MKAIFLLVLLFFSLHFEAQANTNDQAYCPPGNVEKVGGHYNSLNYKCYEGAIVTKEEEYCPPGTIGKAGGFYMSSTRKCYDGAIVTKEEEYCPPGTVGKAGGFYMSSTHKCYEGAIVLIDWQYCSIGNKSRGEFYPPQHIPKSATCTSTGTTLQAQGISEMSGNVSILRNGKKVTLKQGSKILEGDKVSTGATGKLSFKFDDGTKIKVGSGSGLVVDTAKFQPNCDVIDDPDNCSYGLTLLQGGFRWVTGLIGKHNKRSVHITSVNSGIGIRGTDFEMAQIMKGDNSGALPGLYIAVYEGAIYTSNKVGSLDATAGQYVYVKSQYSLPVVIQNPPDVFGR